MSITNGERLATKQDLADMYQGIFPYLGGMPEMVANKFSKGDLYSTEEKMIGQWIDGKPLYQKVVTTTSPSSNSDESIYDYGAGNELKDYHGFLVKSNSMYDLNTHFLSAFDIVSYVYIDGHSIQMQCSRATEQGQTVVIILKYTKTTDSAISIGSDTEYSTEEKIVGTWIDGKPIYQKYYPSRLTLSLNAWVDTGISKGSISKIISVEAYTDNGTAISSVSSSCDGTNIKICSSVGATLYDVHGFTLRYIKTI